ncbi:MAG: SGNH/GDSL hydrolase family protein [Acholeplasmataceae bacterium]|nr:SGNH/GDSL hydrolase family protein [Acholeplasmataceae bacterium]
MKKSMLMVLCLIMAMIMFGCKKNEELKIRDSEPFWLNNVIKDESVLIVEENNECFGTLAFIPKKIISIKDSSLQIKYVENKDYVIEENKIIRTKDSKMPYLKKEVLYGINMPENEGLSTQPASQYGIEKGYDKVLYTESAFIFKKQIFVTYEYDKNDAVNYKIPYLGDKMPNTMKILNKGNPLSIVVYGASTSTGCNASGSELISVYGDPNSQYVSWGIEPFGKSFPELFAGELKFNYKSEIELLSAAKGGTTSDWGRQNALTRAYNPDFGYTPDLVLILFGTNDSTLYMKESKFKDNITTIINDIREASNKTVEFILIGGAQTNEDAVQFGKGTNYYSQLNEIANEYEGVIAVDVGAIHKMLLQNKNYADFTANNINHPNDYLHRIYAMVLNAALINYEDE